MLQGINDFFFFPFFSFLKKSNLRSRGQTSLERSFRSAGYPEALFSLVAIVLL